MKFKKLNKNFPHKFFLNQEWYDYYWLSDELPTKQLVQKLIYDMWELYKNSRMWDETDIETQKKTALELIDLNAPDLYTHHAINLLHQFRRRNPRVPTQLSLKQIFDEKAIKRMNKGTTIERMFGQDFAQYVNSIRESSSK